MVSSVTDPVDERYDIDIAVPERRRLAFTQKKPFILVGIPAYNEEVAIGSIVLRSLKHADKAVVIDDCSLDSTGEVAKLAGATVLAHQDKGGKGTGIKDIFCYAKSVGADVLVLLDGDGQHNPDEIPDVIEPILRGEADMVIGSRFLKKSSKVPIYRRVGQEMLTIATNVTADTRITDSQSGFRAFSRKTFDCFTFHNQGMGIESEMLIEAANAGINIAEVNVNVRYDVDGSTYNPIVHGFSVMNYVIKLATRKKPILFFGLPGLLLLVVGLVSIFVALDTFNATRNVAVGYVMLFLLCIMAGMLSLINALTLMSARNISAKDP
jgi:glycosyltransferase involved in cell wall biosynthesis